MFLQIYFINYGLILIEVLFSLILLYLFYKIVAIPLLNEGIVKKREISLSLLVCLTIAFGAGVGIRYLIGLLGWFVIFFRAFNSIYFSFALMTTIVYPLYMPFLRKYSIDNMKQLTPELKKRFFRRSLFLIIATWITVLLFLGIDFSGIYLGEFIPTDPQNPNYDLFLLGVQWTFLTLVFDVIFTKLIIKLLPMNRRPQKKVLDSSLMFGSLSAFLLWSVQMVTVELFLSRFLNIQVYTQDIRFLILIVSITYIVAFILSYKFRFLKNAIKDGKRLIQEDLDLKEKEILKDKQIFKERVILEVKDLKTHFYTEEGVVHAVEGVSFKIHEGEVLGLVGETGCGKSVTALSILQLIRPPGKILRGEINFLEEDLLKKTETEILSYRGGLITMIFQDPLNSLNPVFTIGKQISEVILLHKTKELLVESSKLEDIGIYGVARAWSKQLLKDLNIPSPETILDRYPHELSGGMRQRVQIAIGIACSPKLLIADEPTTALDVTIQNQILKLMKDLKVKYNTSVLFITHDLAIISKMCDRVAVMYSGRILEYGKTGTLFKTPYHPYTKGLLSAAPVEGVEELKIIPGTVPNLIHPPSGCRFHPRCKFCFEPCNSEIPESTEVVSKHFVACHLYNPKYKHNKEVLI